MGVDFGPILAPILAPFWYKNGGKNEVEKKFEKKRPKMKKVRYDAWVKAGSTVEAWGLKQSFKLWGSPITPGLMAKTMGRRI